MSFAEMENIIVSEVYSEGLKRVYDIFLPATLVEDLLNVVLKKKAAEASLAGFRKGKATLSVLRKAYDVDAMLDQVVIDQSYSSLIKFLHENGKNVVSTPKIVSLDVKGYKSDKKDAKCSFQIELMPELPLIQPQDIEVNSYIVDITDEDVEKNIEILIRESFGHVKEESADYAVKSGDVVYIDFVGKVAGKPFKGGTAKDFKVLVGGGKLVSEIEVALLGMHLNEEKDVDVVFDAAYHDKDLAGKCAKFNLHLNSIDRKVTLNSEEDLVNYWNCDSNEALRQKVRENLVLSAKKIARDLKAQDFSLKVDALYVFDVPESMVQQERDTINEYYRQNPDQASGLKEKLELAEARVKFGMMFAKFAKIHNIAVTTEEIKNKVMSMVYDNVNYASYVVDLLKKDPNMLKSMNADILENKVLDVLLSEVKSVEKNVTFEELLKIANGAV